MGTYINPPGQSKEDWLAEHGMEVEPIYPLEDESLSLVCLVQNPLFSAAAVIFDEKEWGHFTRRDDDRPRRWFVVPTAKLDGVSR